MHLAGGIETVPMATTKAMRRNRSSHEATSASDTIRRCDIMISQRTFAQPFALLSVLLFFIGTVPADSPEMEGDRRLACGVSAPGASFVCTPNGRDDTIPPIQVGNASRVTITVTWDAVNSMANELRLSMDGNPACYETTMDESCSYRVLEGPSPLSLSLTGEGASNTWLGASLHSIQPCTGGLAVNPPCEFPPVRVWMNQDYHFVWSVEP